MSRTAEYNRFIDQLFSNVADVTVDADGAVFIVTREGERMFMGVRKSKKAQSARVEYIRLEAAKRVD